LGSELFKDKKDKKGEGDKIIDILEKFLCKYIPIFGDAGDGKTNLACSICKNLVDENLPALLILGSELNGNESIKDQIMSFFDTPRDMTFRDFLGSLNNLGFAYGIRIPIIIDGLNETCPTAHIWKKEVAELADMVVEFKNIILITTCRDRYVKQIFDKDSYRDVESHLHLGGFTKYNIDEVIDKYFVKYQIKVKNLNFDKNLLQKPIILKMFSKVNEGKEVSVTPFNLYQAIEEYFNLCITHISTIDGVTDPALEKIIKKRLVNFSKKMWDDSVRSIKYPEEFLKIFDPDYSPGRDNFSSTVSNKIINEGVFVSRKLENKDEYIEFSYDLLGGYYIAKAVFLDDKDSIKIVQGSVKKLVNRDQEKNHPLSEDIIRAISYLLPQKIGKQIFEIVDHEKILHDSITMIDLITNTEDGKKAFSIAINKIDIDNKNLDYLLDVLISKAIENDDVKNVDLIVSALLRMNHVQIDLKWSELLRKRKWDSLKYLNKKINYTEDQDEVDKNIFSFIALIGTTPDKSLRDISTKTLVKLGEKSPKKLFESLKILITFKDLYVIERLICAIFGVVVSIDDKDLVFEICDYIEKDLIKNLKTNHALILDYSHLILKYAEKNYGRKVNMQNFYFLKSEVWKEDEECRKKIDGDGKATWGYGPIDMDFAKYKIGFVASHEHYAQEELKTPTLKECLAMVIWKMKQNGYKEEEIKILQKEINEEAKEKRISININYGEKYSLIAFHELCGYFIVNNLMDPEYGHGFRYSNLDIDPVFPVPPKRQIDLNCYSPRNKTEIINWVNDDKNYFKDFYSYKFKDSTWILLNARLTQENTEIDTRMYSYLNTYFVEKGRYLEFEDYVENGQKGIISFDARIPERYYLSIGELSWSNNVPDGRENYNINNNDLEVCNSCFDYICEGHRSEINSFSSLTLLCKYLSDELKLKFVPNKLSYVKDDVEAVKYISDDYSHYVFIKQEVLSSFLKKNNYMMMFFEYGSRYAKWKNIEEEKGEKGFKDFRNISWLDINNDKF
jgi:hypothetical protein